MPKHERKHPHLQVPTSKALKFVDREALDRALESLLPDAAERAFVRRCVIEEGPIHHRGANYLLVRLLARALERTAGVDAPSEPGVEVPMRLPPHLEDEVEEGHYPLRLETRALRDLVGDGESLDAAIDCLTDGPPQHALANVVMVALLDRLLARLGARR